MWNHEKLLEDLTTKFDPSNTVIIKEPNLGSAFKQRGHVPKPDLVVMNKAYKPNITIYEVKATRSDLLHDTKSLKWEKYLPFADRLYFALAPGVVWEDVLGNQPVGIMQRGANGWRTVRSAPKNPHRQVFPEEVWLSLIFKITDDRKQKQSRVERLEHEKEALLRNDLKVLAGSKIKELRELAVQINSDTEKIKYAKQDARAEIFAELQTQLKAKSWLTVHNLDDILKVKVLEPVNKLLTKNLNEVLELLKPRQ